MPAGEHLEPDVTAQFLLDEPPLGDDRPVLEQEQEPSWAAASQQILGRYRLGAGPLVSPLIGGAGLAMLYFGSGAARIAGAVLILAGAVMVLSALGTVEWLAAIVRRHPR